MRIAPQELKKALLKGAKLVTKETQASHLSGPKMPRGQGDPTSGTLAVQTGRLRRSIAEKVTVTKTGAKAQVGTNVSYARAHEKGLRVGYVKMPQRPFLRPSVDEEKPKIMEMLLDSFLKAYHG